MRKSLLLIALSLLACTDAFVVLEGRIYPYFVDPAPGPGSSTRYVLEHEGGETALAFTGPVSFEHGTRLRVHGRYTELQPLRLGSTQPFAVERHEVLALPETTPHALVLDPGRAPPPRRLLVVLFNFSNDTRQPITIEEARRRIFTGPQSTRAFFKEQSYGIVDLQGKAGPEGDVVGWYTIAGINRPCTQAAWGEAALAEAKAKGFDPTGYDNTVFIFPATDACPYLGLGQQPGKLTWINGASIATFTHELGHNLGTPHAAARACWGKDGQRATIAESGCRDSEYGNPFDVMGAGFHHTHAANKAQARWLTGGNVVEADKDGVYTLEPQEKPSSGPQLLSVWRSDDSYYYVEYRQPFGFDDFPAGSPAVSGLIVVEGAAIRQFTKAALLDMNPQTSSFDDAPLGLGQSFVDAKAGIRITLLERTAEAAKVEVKFATPGTGAATDAGAADGGAADARPDAGSAGTGGSGSSGGTGGARAPAMATPAPPFPEPASGCSYAPSSRGGGVVALLLIGGLLVRRRRILLALLLCSACTKYQPSSPRTVIEPRDAGRETATPMDAARTGDAGSDARDTAAPGDTAPDSTADAAGDVPPPMVQIVLPMVPEPVGDTCAAYARTYCARLTQCIPGFLAPYGTMELCQARRERACRIDFLTPARNEQVANRVGCTDAIMKTSCNDHLQGAVLPACSPPGGTLVEGAPCFMHAQCKLGLRCKIDADTCGTCRAELPAGADCGWWYGGCGGGTGCYDDRCLAPRRLGESCKNTPAPCEAGLACTATGCRARTAAVGASCATDDLCARGSYCHSKTKQCTANPAAVAIGETCDTFDENGGPRRCSDDATCVAGSSAVTASKTCIAKAPLGGSCDASKGIECKPPAACARGTCVMPVVVNPGSYTPQTCN